MPARPTRGLSAILILATLMVLGGGPPVYAQVKQFNVPLQPATTGIPEFARQAGIQILVSEPLVRGKQTAAVMGSHSLEEALAILLAGTGLAATSVDGTTYTLAAARPPTLPGTPVAKPQAAGSDNDTTVPHAVPESGSEANQLDEIVVTASKRPEYLSKAPFAVSAVNQADLDRSGINDLTSVATQVPNLQLSSNGFSMRGLGSSNITDQSFSTVAVHIDGVYEQRSQILSLAMYDINRVEVLRGPQGTLYGRNATAGVVNIVTNDPQKTFGVSGDVAYGNYNEVTVRGVLNLPVADSLALRLVYVSQNNDGYSDFMAPDGRRFDMADNRTVRLTGLWTPTDSFSWRLALSHSSNQGTTPYEYPIFYSTFPSANFATGVEGRPSAPIAIAGTPYASPSYTVNGLDEQDNAVKSTMKYRIGDSWSVSYVSGWSEFDNDSILPSTPSFFFLQHNRATAASHELDLNYDNQRMHGILGGYYYHEKLEDLALIHEYDVIPAPWNELLGGVGSLPLVNPTVDLLSHSPNRFSQSAAGFGQLTFDVTDAFRLTGGVRYSSDKEGNDHQFVTICGKGTATTLSYAETCGLALAHLDIGGLYTSSSNTSWKTTAEYDLTSGAMLYGTVSTGYRAGGVADKLTPVAAQTFRPEHLTNYELGLRTQWFSHRLSVNATVFDMDYKDLQVTTLLQQSGLSPSPVTLNAARATIRGLELETVWKATFADTLSGYLSALRAKFDSFPNGTDGYLSVSGSTNTALTAAGYPTLPLQPYDFSGNDLPNAPRFSARLNYAHAFPMPADATLSPILSIYYQTRSFLDASNEPATEQDSYANVDATLRFDPSSKSYFVEGYVYNLGDKRIILAPQTESWGLISSAYGPPRRFGVRAGFKF